MASKKGKSKLKRFLVALLISFASIFTAILISQTYPLKNIELKWLDKLFDLRGQIDVSDSPVVLLALDEDTDDEMPEKWPYPLEYYAKVVENLNKAGAKVIVIDVLLQKADQENSSSDTLLAKALATYGNVILSGDINVDSKVAFGEGSRARTITVQLSPPQPLFTHNNPNPWGFVSIFQDQDGFVRNYMLKRDHLDKQYLSVGLEAIRKYKEYSPDMKIEETVDFYTFGDFDIPKTSSGMMLINFHGLPASYPKHSFGQVIDDSEFLTLTEDPEFQLNMFDDPAYGLLYSATFRDKIVIIGATMPALNDFQSTPFGVGRTMPGYEIHANAIQTILTGNYIRDIDLFSTYMLIALLGLIICFTALYIHSWVSFAIIIMASISTIVASAYLFTDYNTHMDITGFMLVIFVGYLGSIVYDFFTEQREKKRIKNMFSSYVSPDLVEQMVNSEEEPQLGGDEVYITAFFSDIQSFSTFSEKLTPKQLVDLINEYLTAMTDILTEQNGTLDKYIGDAIVAFFGAPVPIKDHAFKGCLTSQLLHLKQAELREKWKAEGNKWPEVISQMQTRVGLNTGFMVTGNMGSFSRFNYTMMGDNVNLGARCESGAKSYGVYTMVTEETRNEALKFGDDCVFRHLDKIVVKGRSIPVNMFEIVGLRQYLNSSDIECIQTYEAGFEQYLAQNFNKAIELFTDASKIEPIQPGFLPSVKTNPSLIMLDRCEEMKKLTLPEDWDGVYIMTSK